MMHGAQIGLVAKNMRAEQLPGHEQNQEEALEELSADFLQRLRQLSRRYTYFHSLMLALLLLELSFLLSSLFWITQSALLAFSLAGLFLSCLAYYVFYLYLQSSHPQQLVKLATDFITSCQKILPKINSPEHSLALADSCWKLAKKIQGQEYRLYHLPLLCAWKPFRRLLEQVSCRKHWQDFYRFKELLLMQAIAEHVELVKCAPTSLEVHAALANAYVILSDLYAKGMPSDEEAKLWHPAHAFEQELQEKFRLTSQRAVEELKILETYAPDNIWVHAQLAYSYRDLQMPEEEIHEYEAMLRLDNSDKTVLAALGALYFSAGRKAEGLRIYEVLKELDEIQAEQLIGHYASALPWDTSCSKRLHRVQLD